MTSPNQTPDALRVHLITPSDPPQFPCWLWARSTDPKSAFSWCYFKYDPRDLYPPCAEHMTHWHPDQPTPPPLTPDASTTGKGAEGRTPETDALERDIPQSAELCEWWHQMDAHARSLEQQRNALNETVTLFSQQNNSLHTELALARAELAEAKGELEATKDGLAHFTKLSMEPGHMEAHIKQHPALRELIAKTFAAMVAESPNYTEMKFDQRGTDNWITVTVQKATGLTPHQKRVEAENQLTALRAQVEELKAALEKRNQP